jgi:Holliday junction resolvase
MVFNDNKKTVFFWRYKMTPHQRRGKENQKKGEDFERKVHNIIKRSGAVISARSSGSKGFADVISLSKDGNILLTLCKTNGYLEPKERKQINLMLKILKKQYVPKLELRYYKSKRKMGKMFIDNNWEERYNKLKPYREE